ncbi:TetR/AcrR family transcriptional regulator [Ihubacter massiliensis]|uniref:TetR/AcrR family transcriptional regulator n=1 Tax=Hominibacterium faecale TaxID=2839743 RepID=A0A9J6QPV7_9FIRM|nr:MULTISPECIES: TetR/AcrR family transcriptional regulator [Eubacteriales Family XIII. Incertae Sedis]MCI7303936.1 TetR/AcrR family transcriptional regulator [Clostridia bacterium]MCO7123208.1 TetR/AcrR family transcriptional regulator [Ihubacter massiliensis]MCU7377468.1 TetR/AcrR family transcriptional regulator [Hominibacterium faecale]MDY3009972.1 TetR/AcrR family transcriptional regulator [Clostridiales Family XIII bacterium]
MNDKFYNLPVEKQNAIINAALHVFAENDYKKASTEEITRLAGISKGLLFHYFGSKKELYLHLYQYAEKSLIEGMRRYYDSEETDFFKALISAQMAKVQVLHQHPDLISFLVRAYLEHDDAVEAQIDTRFRDIISASRTTVLERTDGSKFKESISPDQALDIILWMSDGFMRSRTPQQLADLEALNEEFLSYMDLLRRHFYKEEYWDEHN